MFLFFNLFSTSFQIFFLDLIKDKQLHLFILFIFNALYNEIHKICDKRANILQNRNVHEVCIMVDPCSCCMLLKLSWQSSPCTPIQITCNTYNLFFLFLTVGQIKHPPNHHLPLYLLSCSGCLLFTRENYCSHCTGKLLVEVSAISPSFSMWFSLMKEMSLIRDVWVPHTSSSGWLNLVQWHLIFVGSQHVTHLVPRILRWLLDFCKIYATLDSAIFLLFSLGYFSIHSKTILWNKQESSWVAVSKASTLLILYECIPLGACPDCQPHF